MRLRNDLVGASLFYFFPSKHIFPSKPYRAYWARDSTLMQPESGPCLSPSMADHPNLGLLYIETA